jgi:hypothetical protein
VSGACLERVGPWSHRPNGPMGPMGPWAHMPNGPNGPIGPIGPMGPWTHRPNGVVPLGPYFFFIGGLLCPWGAIAVNWLVFCAPRPPGLLMGYSWVTQGYSGLLIGLLMGYSFWVTHGLLMGYSWVTQGYSGLLRVIHWVTQGYS